MRGIALLLILLLKCPICCSALGEHSELAVTLRSSKPNYSLNDDLHLEIQLSNTGTTPLLIRRQLGWGVGRTDIRVFDSNGKQVFTSFLADEVPTPPKETDFVELDPNEFFGVRLKEPLRHFVNRPGNYHLVVDYTSTVDEQWTRKQLTIPNVRLWGRDRGTIKSNRIKIAVTR